MHADLHSAPWQLTDVQRIVDVLAARRIHTAYGQMPQILSARNATSYKQRKAMSAPKTAIQQRIVEFLAARRVHAADRQMPQDLSAQKHHVTSEDLKLNASTKICQVAEM